MQHFLLGSIIPSCPQFFPYSSTFSVFGADPFDEVSSFLVSGS
jgi:hypothetical protein